MRMMDLFDLYNNSLADVNSQQGGCLRPYSNFNQWLKNISTDLFNEKFSNAEQSQKNDDQLNQAFLVSTNVVVTEQPGKNYDTISLPSNYGYFSSLRVFLAEEEGGCGCLCSDKPILDNDSGKCLAFEDPIFKEIRERFKGQHANEAPAQKLDNARWGAAADHKLLKPTMQKPAVTQINGLIKIVPRGLGIVILDYFRLPAIPLFAYTTVPGSDAILYDLANSNQLDWPDLVQNEILARVKKKYASATRNPQQYSEAEAERQQSK